MEYIITNDQLDKIMNPYWDHKFADAELGYIDLEGDGGTEWKGIIRNTPERRKLIIGHPSDDIGDTWFVDGEIFGNGHLLFGIETDTFYNAMKRYLKKRYGFNNLTYKII
jgi:hypothetical protein